MGGVEEQGYRGGYEVGRRGMEGVSGWQSVARGIRAHRAHVKLCVQTVTQFIIIIVVFALGDTTRA